MPEKFCCDGAWSPLLSPKMAALADPPERTEGVNASEAAPTAFRNERREVSSMLFPPPEFRLSAEPFALGSGGCALIATGRDLVLEVPAWIDRLGYDYQSSFAPNCITLAGPALTISPKLSEEGSFCGKPKWVRLRALNISQRSCSLYRSWKGMFL